ncbi:MAG: GH92 family glycosyl hydrolase [Longimicrobiales bacterium]
MRAATSTLLLLALAGSPALPGEPLAAQDRPSTAWVDPLIGSANGGNTFPGAVVPWGMIQFSPETTRGDAMRRPAPGGYQYAATRVRGFSLTHLSGTGCRGASGDIPLMPLTRRVTSSPSADSTDRRYATSFSHANETAEPGYYRVRMRDGVEVELTASQRTGAARFTYPEGEPAVLLVRTSDSEVGSGDARVEVDPDRRTITGSVTGGNFCGYIHEISRRDYYTLHFVAELDRPFAEVGTWENGRVFPDSTRARGGTGYGPEGVPEPGNGSGAWVVFDGDGGPVHVRVGISYVSAENARRNLEAENGPGTPLEDLRSAARAMWDEELGRVQVTGGTHRERTIFYTALYHSLLHPNLFSDVNGEYRGFDGEVHRVAGTVDGRAQYANFSGWDVYRSQVQLLALLRPDVASDVARSLYNQARQYGRVWDRWTHNNGATHVMEGDASAMAVASMVAFGGDDFDVDGAYRSLLRAATIPTALDLSNEGCPVMCVGQRPSLNRWLSLGWVPADGNAWGGAGETLEDASADFALAQLARRVGDEARVTELLARSSNWTNVFNPATGYIQDRHADGRWREPFDPERGTGFAEGSSAQYTWMVPFDARGLFDRMGGDDAAVRRLDAFFHTDDGDWALTDLGGLHAEMDNEPSIASPWLYMFAGRPDRTQATLRAVLNTLWDDTPHGIPGNDDLGAMSSWYVWTAIGLYPYYPGRSELLLSSPLFESVEVVRSNGVRIVISAPDARADAAYVHGVTVDGVPWRRTWLPEGFVGKGGEVRFRVGADAGRWGREADAVPPSFSP